MINQNSDKVIIRVPDGLRDRIKSAAASNMRTMNAELIFQLERIYGSATDKSEDRLPSVASAI